jgi:hypothetical protein
VLQFCLIEIEIRSVDRHYSLEALQTAEPERRRHLVEFRICTEAGDMIIALEPEVSHQAQSRG